MSKKTPWWDIVYILACIEKKPGITLDQKQCNWLNIIIKI